jgi:hypothetical protein
MTPPHALQNPQAAMNPTFLIEIERVYARFTENGSASSPGPMNISKESQAEALAANLGPAVAQCAIPEVDPHPIDRRMRRLPVEPVEIRR